MKFNPKTETMKYNRIKLIAAFTMGVMLLTGCGKENDGIVGDWQWTGTSVHHVDNYTGQESTENMDFPAFKDLKFYENGKVDVQQQGIHIPENEPPYYFYQYNYSLNAAADTVYLTDPLDDYFPQTWRIKSLTKENLTVEWTEGDDAFICTTTYSRR